MDNTTKHNSKIGEVVTVTREWLPTANPAFPEGHRIGTTGGEFVFSPQGQGKTWFKNVKKGDKFRRTEITGAVDESYYSGGLEKI